MYFDLWTKESKIEQQTGLLLETLRYLQNKISLISSALHLFIFIYVGSVYLSFKNLITLISPLCSETNYAFSVLQLLRLPMPQVIYKPHYGNGVFGNVYLLARQHYTKSLFNTNSFYTNFTNTHFEKVPIPHLTRTMKQKFLH